MMAADLIDLTGFDPSRGRAEAVSARMRGRLAESLRYIVDQAAGHVTVPAAEMERFLERLASAPVSPLVFGIYCDLVLAIDANALDTHVPNLILQPIVENAIRHGVAPRSTHGEIEIHAKQEDGFLRIQVRDNGPGLPKNRNADSLFKKGLGLSNTLSRLDRLYGEQHRFDIANDPRGGLAVTLEIPSVRVNGLASRNGHG